MLRSGSVRTGTPDGTRDQQTLGDLVALALKDVSQLVSYEIALAKKEFKVDLRRAIIGLAAVAFILIVAYPILILVLFAGVAALYVNGAPGGAWAAFLYVAAACTILALLVGLVGFIFFKKITGMKLTRKTVSEDISMLKRAPSGPADDTAEAVDDRDQASITSGRAPASVSARSLRGR